MSYVLYAIHSFGPAMREDSYEPRYIHSDIHNRTLIDRKKEKIAKKQKILDYLYFNFFLFACAILEREINFYPTVMRSRSSSFSLSFFLFDKYLEL